MDWDILSLDEKYDRTHIALVDRLHEKGIECYFADIWGCDEIAFLVSCKAHSDKIARALNIHKECIYNDFEHEFVILNLFQEKYLRGLL